MWLQIHIMQLEREGSPPPDLRLAQAKTQMLDHSKDTSIPA
jgi:hypothetical protein